MSNLPIIVAHRGASHDAPENTQAAFVLAWIQGADAIEADFRLTKDGEIVCIHDETTGRTTKKNLVVADSTLEQLKALDVGSWVSPQWSGQRIQTLHEVLAVVPEGKLLFLEVKSGVKTVEPLSRALKESDGTPQRVLLLATDHDVLASLRAAFPDYKVLKVVSRKRLTPQKPWVPLTDEVMEGVISLKVDGLSASAGGLLHDRECVQRVLAEGKELHAWTVNRPGNAATLQKLGVASITTDRPGWMKQNLIRRLA